MNVWNGLIGYISAIPQFVQIFLLVGIVFMVRRLLKPKKVEEDEDQSRCTLPPMKKRDFTVEELLEYDGIKNERVLLAVCGKVFDVTKGKSFYGPGTFLI